MPIDGNLALKIEGFEFQDALFDIEKQVDTFDETGELKRIVTGFAAVADVIDSQYEVITREALEGAAKDLLHYTTVLYNHDADRPIGKVLEAYPKDSGLFVKVLISSHEDEIWKKITEGVISKFSFRGVVTDYDEQFDKTLNRMITIIKGFKIFEISLVSVPANPHARTLHYYLSKALETSKETQGQNMSNGDTEVVNTIEGGNKSTMDKEKAKAIAAMVDKLIAALQDMPHMPQDVDERLVAICRAIKAEVLRAAGEEYPYPNPSPNKDIEGYDPVLEGIKSRLKAVEGALNEITKRLDDMAPALEARLLESTKSVAEQLVADRFDELQKQFDEQAEVLKSLAEFFEALRPTLGLPAGASHQGAEKAAESAPKSTGGEA